MEGKLEVNNVNDASEAFNKIIIHPSFNKAISEMNRIRVTLPNTPSPAEWDLQYMGFPTSGKMVAIDEGGFILDLNAKNGAEYYKESNGILAYDESINQYKSLQGTAYLFSHSLILHNQSDYLPATLIKFYFYTRSKELAQKSSIEEIKYSDEIESDSKRDYIEDRFEFILNRVPSNSILFIDGPLVGGQVTHQTIELNNALTAKNILPVFFVKNSSSNLVTDNNKELKNKFNSDMHWAYDNLKAGQRTNFFKYEDQNNKSHSKVFCYLKPYKNVSPQRIEFYIDAYKQYNKEINNTMDLIYYLLLVQGDAKNPQVRSIAIAEMYARETIKFINIRDLMKQAGLTPTMNTGRGM